jgi:uroporphyrinogen-III synthase
MRASPGAARPGARPHPVPLPGGEGTLAGCRVLVAHASDHAEGLPALLTVAGADVVELTTISIVPVDFALPDLDGYAWVVFTSANGVRAAATYDTKKWPPVAVVGTATARAAAEAGLPVAFEPSEPRGAVLGAELPVAPSERVLLLRSDIARPELPAALRDRGAAVDEIVAYRTAPRTEPAPQVADDLARGQIDAIVLSSPSSVRGLTSACGRSPSDYATTRLVAIGPTTAAAIAEVGLPVAAQAAEPSDQGLFDALVALWKERT